MTHDVFIPYIIFFMEDKFGYVHSFNSEELKNWFEHPLSLQGWKHFPLIIAN